MEKELKDLIEESNKVWEEQKKYQDRMEAEVERLGTVLPETKSALDKMNARLDAIEAKANTPPANGGNENLDEGHTPTPDEKKAFEKKAYVNFLRKGLEFMAPEEVKALTVADDTTGGYLAPLEQATEMLEAVQEFSPMRSLCRVRQTSFRGIDIKKKTGHTAATWVEEVGTKQDGQDAYAFGNDEIIAKELSAVVDISNQDLEDPQFNIEADVNMDAGEQFGVAEGTAFVTGNGVGKPFGIFDAAMGLEILKSGSSGTFDADDLIDLMIKLKEPYLARATWQFRRTTLGYIRKLKANNEYIWTPASDKSNSVVPGFAPTILGLPYKLNPDIPAVAADAKAITVGDWQRCYTILDRLMVTVLRDPFTQALNGKVRFVYRKRTGGKVVMAEASKILKLSA